MQINLAPGNNLKINTERGLISLEWSSGTNELAVEIIINQETEGYFSRDINPQSRKQAMFNPRIVLVKKEG